MPVPQIDQRTLQLLQLHYKLLEQGVEPMAIARMGMFMAILELDAQGATYTQIMNLFRQFLDKFTESNIEEDEVVINFGTE
tara:strand:+ start:1270 stop:1512 length:243 start_codon:yes stop_codon:yes gene_type:complete